MKEPEVKQPFEEGNNTKHLASSQEFLLEPPEASCDVCSHLSAPCWLDSSPYDARMRSESSLPMLAKVES